MLREARRRAWRVPAATQSLAGKLLAESSTWKPRSTGYPGESSVSVWPPHWPSFSYSVTHAPLLHICSEMQLIMLSPLPLGTQYAHKTASRAQCGVLADKATSHCGTMAASRMMAPQPLLHVHATCFITSNCDGTLARIGCCVAKHFHTSTPVQQPCSAQARDPRANHSDAPLQWGLRSCPGLCRHAAPPLSSPVADLLRWQSQLPDTLPSFCTTTPPSEGICTSLACMQGR